LFCKANLVPVGQDQLPHVEVTRLIARRFNQRFGAGVFPLPDALLSEAPLLLGTDGAKMSKSRGNTIPLAASADQTATLIRGARTDAVRHITYDPDARPEVSSLVLLAALCLGRDPHQVAAEIGGGGAAALKDTVTEAVNEMMAPIRARRAEYARDPGYVRRVLREGNERANDVASATLAEVRAVMGMGYR
jgi:tryptophanyl-tRNA synthetase